MVRPVKIIHLVSSIGNPVFTVVFAWLTDILLGTTLDENGLLGATEVKMGYWQQFYDFDPKEDRVPFTPFSLLQDIVWRARALLRNRSKEEIHFAAQTIDWMIENHFEQEVVHPGIVDPDDDLDLRDSNDTSEVEVLKECIGNYSLEDEEFRNATQQEFFAVLGLWLVADCLQWLGRSRREQKTSSAKPTHAHYSLAGQAAIKAMDAVCYAEHLRAIDQRQEKIQALQQEMKDQKKEIKTQIEQKLAQRRSEDARRAAKKRHEETALIKQETIEYYEANKNEFRSIEDAASKIAGKIVPVKHRTVAQWISAHRKMLSTSKL